MRPSSARPLPLPPPSLSSPAPLPPPALRSYVWLNEYSSQFVPIIGLLLLRVVVGIGQFFLQKSGKQKKSDQVRLGNGKSHGQAGACGLGGRALWLRAAARADSTLRCPPPPLIPRPAPCFRASARAGAAGGGAGAAPRARIQCGGGRQVSALARVPLCLCLCLFRRCGAADAAAAGMLPVSSPAATRAAVAVCAPRSPAPAALHSRACPPHPTPPPSRAGGKKEGTGVKYADVAGIDHIKADIKEASNDASSEKWGWESLFNWGWRALTASRPTSRRRGVSIEGGWRETNT